MVIHHGCPPYHITRLSQTYYPPREENGKQVYDLNFEDGFYPIFEEVDEVTMEVKNFTGAYRLMLIGGGPSLDSVQRYSQEELRQYNPTVGVISRDIVWTPYDEDVRDNIMDINKNSVG
jgi:hypothetical protein